MKQKIAKLKFVNGPQKMKNCRMIASAQIFIAFTFIFMDFGIKSYKIEHTFKTQN